MMDNWQFFLQKEGDYAWLPLETPQVEILEGRYHLIAHTSHPGQVAKVNIRYQYELDDIPQENIQEITRPIEVSGKIEVLPLTYLGLGAWSISCQVESEEASSESQVETFDLEIDVLSQDFDLFEGWNFEEVETSTEESQESFANMLPWLEQTLEIHEEAAPVLAPQALLAEEPTWGLEDDVMSSVLEAESIVAEESQETHPLLIKSNSDITLDLPSFSGNLPQIVFRTVSSTDLPQRVCDRELSDAERPTSPQLPTFTHVKSIAFQKQNQRTRSLSKMKLIAGALNHKAQPEEIGPSHLQEKFHQKLNQLAVLSQP